MIALALALIVLALALGRVCLSVAGNARTPEQINAVVGLGLATLIALVAGVALTVRWLLL